MDSLSRGSGVLRRVEVQLRTLPTEFRLRRFLAEGVASGAFSRAGDGESSGGASGSSVCQPSSSMENLRGGDRTPEEP